MRTENLVVGAGLFGCIIAAALRAEGEQVLVIADQREGMGSLPAACLMKPSWISGLGEDVTKPSLALLDSLYGLHSLRFRAGPIKTDVHWVRPSSILKPPDIVARLERLDHSAGGYLATFDRPLLQGQQNGYVQAKRVIMATGIWLRDFRRDRILTAQHGMAMLRPGDTIEEPFISPWAPYRQLVAFNREDGLWIGDGSALKEMPQQRREEIRARCLRSVGAPLAQSGWTELRGIRPYTREKPCLLQEVSPNLWHASGGAKNGTIAAGYCAHVISRRSPE